jgi:hypothetical protein
MVIDESTAKAAIKKQISVLKRRNSTYKKQQKRAIKSRNKWLKTKLLYLNECSIIIKINRKIKVLEVVSLFPTENGQLKLISTYLDTKKCTIKSYMTKFHLTQHFIVRIMQALKEISLAKLACFVDTLLRPIAEAFKNYLEQDGIYQLYIIKVGVCTVLIENGQLILKTIIDCDWVSGHKKNVYDTMLYKNNNFYLEVPKK